MTAGETAHLHPSEPPALTPARRAVAEQRRVRDPCACWQLFVETKAAQATWSADRIDSAWRRWVLRERNVVPEWQPYVGGRQVTLDDHLARSSRIDAEQRRRDADYLELVRTRAPPPAEAMAIAQLTQLTKSIAAHERKAGSQ